MKQQNLHFINISVAVEADSKEDAITYLDSYLEDLEYITSYEFEVME